MTEPPRITGKILVADDSSADRSAARTILQGAGYTVIEAGDGQQALEIAGRERPDLVILDVVMPRSGGLETCRVLKARAQHEYLPVLMVSTRASVSARVEGLRSGADDYLGKPYDPVELQARIEVLLRTRAAFAAQAAKARAVGAAPPAEDEARPAERLASRATPATLEEIRQAMTDEFTRASRYLDPLACLRVEADEAISAGDPRADDLRALVTRGLRRIDLVDDEGPGVLLLLPDTHFPGALTVADRIVRGGRHGGIPVSVGVSFYPSKVIDSFADMAALARAALDHARAEGGGKVCLYQHQGYLYAPEDR
ncbi:MAG: response regulator [Nannocystaceae bacterium]